MNQVLSLILTPAFLATVIRMTTPILFACLAGMIVDRAGMMNLAVETTMLTGALMGVLISAWTHSAWIGLFGAVTVGVVMSAIIGYSTLVLQADMYMNGVAFNLMMNGGTVFILYLATGSKGMSTGLRSEVLPQVTIPLIDKIPVLGSIISGQNILTYIAVVMLILMHIFLFRTKLGLRLRLAGENPAAAESVGINSIRMKMLAMCISGAMSAMGGCFLSMGYVSWFQANMTSGRGFIGMASSALGGAAPLGGLLASLLFGAADAVSNTLSTLSIPSELVSMIPYVVTIIGLVVSSGAAQRKQKKQLSGISK